MFNEGKSTGNFTLKAGLAFSLVFSIIRCGVGQAEGVSRDLASVKPKVIQSQDNSIHQFSKLHKIIALETTDQALIGRIDKVVCDPKKGDIYVIDKRSTQAIYRFDSAGKFLHRFSARGQGPGEYERLHDAAIGNNNDLFIIGDHQIIRLSTKGKLIKESQVPFAVKDAVAVKDYLYVSAFSPRQNSQDSVFVFDLNLKLINAFGDGSKLNKKFPLVPSNYLTSDGENIYLSDFLQPLIRSYQLDGTGDSLIEFPNQFGDGLDLLAKKNFSPEDDQKLAQNIHHFYKTYSGENFLIINEVIMNREDREINLYFPKSNRYFNFASLRQREGRNDLGFESLVGAYGDDFILTIDDMEKLKSLANAYPNLAGVALKATDNPLLLFITVQTEALPQ